MLTVRKTLERLGWPIEEMSDKQVTQELYRRWFAAYRNEMEDDEVVSIASVTGIVVTMSCQGNLDALCWSPDDVIPPEPVVEGDDAAFYVHDEADEADEADFPGPDRRRFPRSPGKDVVHWTSLFDDRVESAGWLVDYSDSGIAFIAENADTPEIGSDISPSIHTRSSGVIPLGAATVIRIDPLNPDLSLVCAELHEQRSIKL